MTQVHSKTEIEPLTANNKISPSSSLNALMQDGQDNEQEEVLNSLVKSDNSIQQRLLKHVNDLTKTAFISKNDLFENGTTKEFLKNVSFSIRLSGKYSPNNQKKEIPLIIYKNTTYLTCSCMYRVDASEANCSLPRGI